jgi:CRP/FNR family transcriptional regulator, nitrogen oxide reductase regulator
MKIDNFPPDVIILSKMSGYYDSQSAKRLLKQFKLLADLAPDEIAGLAQQTRFEDICRDQVIFYQGDACDRVWLVQSGQVKIVFHDTDGREVILEIISPGEAFGGTVLLFPAQPATAIALEDSVLASFSAQAYHKFLLQTPPTILKLLHMLGVRHLSMINMQTMVGERVERRMAHILLKLAVRTGQDTSEGRLITVPLSRQDLADMACTTLETAIRTISRFQKDGLVATRRGGYLVVKDPQKLEEMVG